MDEGVADRATPPRSRRLPWILEPNAWTRRFQERRAAGAKLLDLTEMNPTRVGLAGAGEEPAVDAAWLEALSDPHAASYEPDPRGLLPAREAVAAYYAARGTGASANHVVLTTGTSESYAHLFRLLADPDDTVLVPSPSYPLFEPIATLEGVRTVSYRLAYDGAWHLDLDSVAAALRGAATPVRAIVVVQPNHPTGSCLSSREIEALEDLAIRTGAALIADEVFIDFPWPRKTTTSLLGPRRVPTFVLGGLSKACGLPQLKLGWILVTGPSDETEDMLQGLEWICDLFLSVGTPVQLALPRLLLERHRFQARAKERIAANLETLRALARSRPELGTLDADGGWSAIVRLPGRRTGEEWSLALLDRDVVVHPDHFYDLEVTSVVASLIVEPAVLREAAGRMGDLVTSS
jgi:aspartate/methionine/tyrosine aminotransferase